MSSLGNNTVVQRALELIELLPVFETDPSTDALSRWRSKETMMSLRVPVLLLFCLLLPVAALAQDPLVLDETCRVKVSNRTALVQPDGTFLIRNIPIFLTSRTGILPQLNRVRATCLRNGQMVRGQSEYFTLEPGQETFVADVYPSEGFTPIPRRITLSVAQRDVFQGDQIQLVVTAHYADGTSGDISSKAAGTTFLTTRPQFLSTSEDGLLTGVNTTDRPRYVTVTAFNEGNLATILLRSFGPPDDLDNDGMPNDWEDLYGFNKLFNDANDNLDGDGLVNVAEYLAGTLPNHVDTDLDTLIDGFDNDPLRYDDMAPVIVMTSPLDGDSYLELQDVPVQLDISENEVIDVVELRVDGSLVLTSATPPFAYTLPMPREVPGITLDVLARDTVGNTSTSSRFVPAVIDAPPVLAVTAPVEGQLVGEGTILEVTAQASDDLELLDVTFSVDGIPRQPQTAPPFTINHPVAMGAANVVIEVAARDRIQTTTVTRTVTVTDDPFTTVTGRTLDDMGQPLPSVLLSTNLGGTANSDVNGDFTLLNIPSLQGDVQVQALASIVGGDLTGRSDPFVPVANGTTDVGDIVLRPRSALFPGRRYDTGTTPFDIDFADFNGDGIDDIVTANFNSDDLSVLLGTGNGNFADDLRLDTCENPREVAIADFNGDSHLDVAATCSSAAQNSVSIHLGTGLGTFAAEQLTVSGPYPSGLCAGDFDGDGNADLAVTHRTTDDVGYLRGLGNGTFQAAVTYAVGDQPSRIGCEDLDSDGDLDLVVLNSNGSSFSVLANPGNAVFTMSMSTMTPEVRPDYLALGDIDGDGLMDAAIGHRIESKTTLWQGTGTSFLYDSTLEVPLGRAEQPELVDVDQDGHLDLLIADPSSNERAYLLRGAGDGTFGVVEDLVVGAYGSPLKARDIDTDGDLDLVVVQNNTDNVAVFYALQPAVFNQAQILETLQTPVELTTGDFNLDGNLDVVSTDRDEAAVSIFLGNGDGTFQPRRNVEVDLKPKKVVVVDFNADGIEDLVVANSDSNSLALLNGIGDGNFGFLDIATNDEPEDLAVADFNGDGFQDLVVANNDFNTDAVGVHFGDGVGFGTYQLIGTVADPVGVAVGDFDEDGHIDIAASSFDQEEAAIFLGNGDGTFQAGVGFGSSLQVFDIATDDIDGDGHLDLVVANSNSGNGFTHVWRGFGNGSFSLLTNIATGGTSQGVTLGDVNLDGAVDIIVGNGAEAVISLSNGDGTFRDPQRYTRASGTKTAVGDFNNDGQPDLAVTGGSSDTLWILLQQ